MDWSLERIGKPHNQSSLPRKCLSPFCVNACRIFSCARYEPNVLGVADMRHNERKECVTRGKSFCNVAACGNAVRSETRK